MTERVDKPGLVHAEEFDQAIDKLQEAGFVTQLWIDVKNQRLTLRWVRQGARWHITVRGLNSITEKLDQVSSNVNRWCTARYYDTGNETNYAVREQ